MSVRLPVQGGGQGAFGVQEAMKEATARIKINKLLEAAGWRFFPEYGKPANIRLEHTTTLTPDHLNSFGENFETYPRGFIDFLLLNEKGFPLIDVEVNSEEQHQ